MLFDDEKAPDVVPSTTTEENKDDGTPADLDEQERKDLEERKETPGEGGPDATEFEKSKVDEEKSE